MRNEIKKLYDSGLKVPRLKAFEVFDLSATERMIFSAIMEQCITSPNNKIRCSANDIKKYCGEMCSRVSVFRSIEKLSKCNILIVEKSTEIEDKTSTFSINENFIIQIEYGSGSENIPCPLPENNIPAGNDLRNLNDYYNNAPLPEFYDDVLQFIPEDVVRQHIEEKSGIQGIQPIQPEKVSRFVKPTLQEITQVMAVKIREKYGSNVADTLINDQAESFLNYYESNGWKVGKNPMKNWHCAIGNWIKNIKTYSTAGTGTSGALIVATAEQSSRPDFDTIYKEVIDIAGKLQNRSNWLSESANKNIMAGVRTFIAEEIKAHWNLYGESDWKNALNVFIFAQKSPLRYLDPNFCKNNGFDSGLYNEFWTGSTFFIPRSSDEPTVTEQVIESEHFQKSLQEDLERKRRVSEFKKKLNAHREEMANAYK